jgi:hypothetical protein
LLLEVADSSEEKPELRHARDDDVSGRGLALVDTIAADWGVRPREGVGKAYGHSCHSQN